ncbi:MAG TPA: 23S rRNA (guanosine(2251)-2'-O)-methyltransferase RlmB [Bacteroidales bacterium]|nr:23S rRNA (guanosine(2251)-2'-O)-methyltransferase RlmB [Bacteroidales bacterium]
MFNRDKQPQPKLVFGIHAVLEAVRSGKEIEKLIIKKEMSGEALRELMKACRERNIPYQFVPVDRFDRITRKNHQGLIAYMAEIEYQPLEMVVSAVFEDGREPAILILDHITDVRNFGSIARTAECAGFDAIAIPDKGAAQINSDAIKTSSGALHNINICRVTNLTNAVKYLKDCGLKVFAATEKAKQPYYKTNMKGPVAIVLGAEDAGISPEILRYADELVQIPMIGKTSSLNVSVAAGIIIYEVVKQRLSDF